jgi:hypothetical protein
MYHLTDLGFLNVVGSDVFHFNMAGTRIIVISSTKAARELFETKSVIYSSRPRWVMMNELYVIYSAENGIAKTDTTFQGPVSVGILASGNMVKCGKVATV